MLVRSLRESSFTMRSPLLVALILAVAVLHPTALGADDVEPTPIYVYSLTEAAIPVPDFDSDFLTWSVPVMRCESSGIADNINKSSGARGLLQLMAVHQNRAARLGLSWDDMLTPIPNLTVAESIWKEQGESPWIESASCVRRLLND